MSCISTIDIQTRLDVQELLSHFSHFLDHNGGACFAELFTTDGVFEVSRGDRLQGPVELATLPAWVQERGRGAWRHLITAQVIERLNSRKDLIVRAYCPVLNMDQNSTVAAFYDCEFQLRFTSRWRVRHALVTRIGSSPSTTVGAASVGNRVPVMELQ